MDNLFRDFLWSDDPPVVDLPVLVLVVSELLPLIVSAVSVLVDGDIISSEGEEVLDGAFAEGSLADDGGAAMVL